MFSSNRAEHPSQEQPAACNSWRIAVSDQRGRPIWFGGEIRAAASMSRFSGWLGIRLTRTLADFGGGESRPSKRHCRASTRQSMLRNGWLTFAEWFP